MKQRLTVLACKVLHRARSESQRLVQWCYFRLYALPLLRMRGHVSAHARCAKGFGAFVVCDEATALKVAVSGASTIRKEYANYQRVATKYPALLEFFPNYVLVEEWGVAALACARLSPIAETESLLCAVRLRTELNTASTSPGRLALSDCPEIRTGLVYVEARMGAVVAGKLRTDVEQYLATGDYNIALCHGDFHSRNIMCAPGGGARLIDFDCMRFPGIAEFDALYFSLEREWSLCSVHWSETLASCFRVPGKGVEVSLEAFGVVWSRGLGLAFLLDRIGQDWGGFGLHISSEMLLRVVGMALNADQTGGEGESIDSRSGAVNEE